MSVVTSVNGNSTKEMTDNEFYNECSKNENVELTYLQKINGKNVEKKVSLTKKPEYYIPGGLTKTLPMEKPSTVNMAADTDFDFFDFNTFDFKVEGDDKLMDRSILEALGEVFKRRGLKRDKENPDLIFTVKKSLQQTTNSVYVPETQQVVNTGYTSAVKKNVFTGKNYVSTTAHNKVVRSGGYTHTGVSATFHLEFTILKNDSVQAEDELPVVWKLDYNKFSSSAIDVLGETKDDVSYWCSQYPFGKPMFSYQMSTTGVFFESEDAYWNGEVLDVLPGTDAYNKGLRGGDKILKAYEPLLTTLVCTFAKSSYFKAGYQKRLWSSFWFYCVPIPYARKNSYLKGKDYLTLHKPIFMPKAYFKVLQGDGEKRKMRAPFDVSRYYYEYIY